MVAAAALGLLTPIPRASSEPTAIFRPFPNLLVGEVVTGLTIPWDLGFTPDGTLVFTEKSGRLSAVIDGAARLLAAPTDVFSGGEAGMMGLAVDPAFSANRIVHVCQGYRDGTTTDVRVYRWQIAEDWMSASRLGGPTVSGMPVSNGRHAGCRTRFDADGFLWISTGDAAIGTTPQDLSSLGGKVLRIVAATGEPAPGNPFGTPVYTYGHRNVQGLALHPETRLMYSAEHGPDRDDEVNVVVRGGNYGWDPVPGYNESVPMTDRNKYPTAIPAVWSSGSPTIAVSGITWVVGSQWQGWDGALIGATLKGSHLHVWRFHPGGVLLFDEWVRLPDRGRLRSVVQGPDGYLYVATSNAFGTDAILRIVPT